MLTFLKSWTRPDTFHAVLSERSGRWYNACLRITRDADLAADAVQEALLKAWDRRDEFRGKSGIIGSDTARTALREIYSRSGDKQIKDAALQDMLMAGDEQGVLALYRAATTTDEKRELLRTLTMMDGDAALEAIDSALEGKK